MTRAEAIQKATAFRKSNVVAFWKSGRWMYDKFESISEAKVAMRLLPGIKVALRKEERLADVCQDRL